ncbi:hypothetical protein L9F63_007116 [Diploptera punctata]|uniref:Uncharacterized protein n=1 Tax=Diploptera punctata TaxID=6984 RepID=A0AAD7Z934_DIPPU|nr:hypothetical protein L9F63_007116 [Diploptera punctata]
MSVTDNSFTGFSTTELLNDFNENYQAAEKLAIETIISTDAPLFNTFRELSRRHCIDIMKKLNTFNVTEQAIVLVGLTDYVTCAYNNELFDTFCKKQDVNNFSTLLCELNRRWVRLFRKHGSHDLSDIQLKNIISLLKHSLKRLPSNYYTNCMTECVKLGEFYLERAHLPQPAINKEKLANSKVKLDNKNNNISAELAKKHKSSRYDFKSQQNCNSNENKIPEKCIQITSKSKLQKKTVDLHKPAKVDLISPVKKTKRKKYNADIMKYILKSSENKDKGLCSNSTESETKSKDSLSEERSSITCGTDLDTKLEDPINQTTPTGKQNSTNNSESPSKKKPRIEVKSTVGKINAFELMMKHSRAVKGQTVKRKSLFQ